MKKINTITVEDYLAAADLSYNRMIKDVSDGMININQIVSAMSMINNAHYRAIHENKRHLFVTEQCKDSE